METNKERYYLLDLERTVSSGIAHYWNQNRHGYTDNIKEAGKFLESVAKKEVDSDFNKRTVMISVKAVEEFVS